MVYPGPVFLFFETGMSVVHTSSLVQSVVPSSLVGIPDGSGGFAKIA